MHIFYTPDIKKQFYQLSEEESKHAARVLRIKIGDLVNLIDGRGGFYIAEIIDNHPKRSEVKVIEKIEHYGKRSYSLHLAMAPTKNIDRFEWFLEKATEFGIDEITPILSAHSERKIIKPERLMKIIIAAAKQSKKAYLPVLHPMISFQEFAESRKEGDNYIAHLVDGKRDLLSHVANPKGKSTVIIGPEGDFSSGEVHLALQKGFQPVSLGKSRLRTETAGVAVVHTYALLSELACR